jgi:hypothetical protein
MTVDLYLGMHQFREEIEFIRNSIHVLPVFDYPSKSDVIRRNLEPQIRVETSSTKFNRNVYRNIRQNMRGVGDYLPPLCVHYLRVMYS